MRSLDQTPMRHEAVFSDGGAYRFVVDNNIIMHREGIEVVTVLIGDWLNAGAHAGPCRVLDLACGGAPFTIAEVMAAYPAARFAYTGVDINPDQVRAARTYPLAANVTTVFAEGDVWNLDGLNGPFDLVFVGMNTHHATPEELTSFTESLPRLLAPGGLFLNHDGFRPDALAPIPRGTPQPQHPSQLWKKFFIDSMGRHMASLGAMPTILEGVASHMYERDYPFSPGELKAALEKAGLRAETHTFLAYDHPLREFYAVAAARRRAD